MKVKAYDLVNSVDQEELDAGLLAESFLSRGQARKGSQPTRCLLIRYPNGSYPLCSTLL